MNILFFNKGRVATMLALFFMFLGMNNVFAQVPNCTVKVKVYGPNGLPLAGWKVRLQSDNLTCGYTPLITDANGESDFYVCGVGQNCMGSWKIYPNAYGAASSPSTSTYATYNGSYASNPGQLFIFNVTPHTITGSSSICLNSTQSYNFAQPSATSVTGTTTFSWSVPAGLQIMSGAGTSTVSIKGVSAGNYQFSVTTNAGTFYRSVSVVTAAPSQPGSIIAQQNVGTCYYQIKVNPVTSASQYVWNTTNNVATGTIGTNVWDSEWPGGQTVPTLYVWAKNICGTSPVRSRASFTPSVPGGCQWRIANFDTELNQELLVSPNPATDHLSLQLPSDMEMSKLTVVNMNGQVVMEKGLDVTVKDFDLDISTLPSGMYLLKLEGAGKPEIQKFIKE